MSNSPSSEISSFGKFHELADYLDDRRGSVLISWREAVDGDKGLDIVSRLTRAEFEDNITSFLVRLSQEWRQEEPQHNSFGPEPKIESDEHLKLEEKFIALQHGFHRWQEGYDIRQMMTEWNHLSQTLLHFLNEFEATHPEVGQPVMATSRVICARLLAENLTESVAEYQRIQQAEAKEIVDSLSQALKVVSNWERQRGQVLREAVHDLRGNLSAVQGASQLLGGVADNEADPGIKPQILNVLQRSTEVLYQMLTDLLDLARLEAGQEERISEPFDAAHLMQDLGAAFHPLAQKKGLYFRFAGPPSLPVQGDAMKVHRIAQNLLLNALKYTRKGGVDFEWQRDEGIRWCLSVKDTGPGFSLEREAHPLIHELAGNDADKYAEDLLPDFNIPGGEGVGLAIVKRLCLLLDAQLEMSTSPGEGTTFRVLFPLDYDTEAK